MARTNNCLDSIHGNSDSAQLRIGGGWCNDRGKVLEMGGPLHLIIETARRHIVVTAGYQEAANEGLVVCCPNDPSQIVCASGGDADGDRRIVFDAPRKGCLVGVPVVGWLGGSASGSKFGCRCRFVLLLPSRLKKASSGE